MVWAAVERPPAFRSLTLIGPWVRDAPTSFFQNLMTAVLLNGPWKVQGWGMFYKTLYPTQKPADFDEYIDKLKSNLRQPGRFEALKGLGFSPKTASEERQDNHNNRNGHCYRRYHPQHFRRHHLPQISFSRHKVVAI